MGKLTRMIRRSHRKLKIWQGGLFIYAENQLDAIKEALFKFQQVNDTKAAIEVSLAYTSGQVRTVMTTSLLKLTAITVLDPCPVLL
jgi:hypothetical protein